LINIVQSQAILDLAQFYIDNKLIPEKYDLDALHIACASLNNVDFLLTFNFKHIIKAKEKIAQINARENLPIITICKPSEVLEL
jgi:hypothetical protein